MSPFLAVLLVLALVWLFTPGKRRSRRKAHRLGVRINWARVRRTWIDATFPRRVAKYLH